MPFVKMKSNLPLELRELEGTPKSLGPEVFQIFLIKPNKK
jgi:hypothetical protein